MASVANRQQDKFCVVVWNHAHILSFFSVSVPDIQTENILLPRICRMTHSLRPAIDGVTSKPWKQHYVNYSIFGIYGLLIYCNGNIRYLVKTQVISINFKIPRYEGSKADGRDLNVKCQYWKTVNVIWALSHLCWCCSDIIIYRSNRWK